MLVACLIPLSVKLTLWIVPRFTVATLPPWVTGNEDGIGYLSRVTSRIRCRDDEALIAEKGILNGAFCEWRGGKVEL
jgi:hypothetical protein